MALPKGFVRDVRTGFAWGTKVYDTVSSTTLVLANIRTYTSILHTTYYFIAYILYIIL
jgi:hypothetical protein